MKKNIVFPASLKAMLQELLGAKTKAEKDHWKAVAIQYIDFLEKYS